MGTVNVNPTNSATLSYMTGPTLFGAAATIPAALSDSDDTTGVHFGTTFVNVNHQFLLQFLTLWSSVPVNARIDWIQPHFRSMHHAGFGFMWLYDLRAFSPVDATDGSTGSTANNPTRYLGLARDLYADGTLADVDCPATRSADDGTPWNDCWYFTLLIGRWVDNVTEFPWDPSTYPYLVKVYLTVGYTKKPLVQTIRPTGTVDTPRPPVSWGVGDFEGDKPLSAHHVIILPTGSTDANGNPIGDSDFDPTTGSGAGYNSGKQFTGTTTRTPDRTLTPGTWYTFIRQYVGTGVDEYASAWTSQSFILDAETVDQPTVVLSDDTASNTLKVTITAGSHTEDLVADTIQVEYLDPTYGWVTAPIADGMVNGTGSSAFYDGLHAPGEEVSYRARGIAVDDTVEFASPWTTSTHTVGNLHEWWLRSSSDYTLNRSLNDEDYLYMRSWAPTRSRPNVTTWGIGARPATMVHDVTKGDVHKCSVWAMTQSAYGDLRALLEDGDDLVLVDPWGELWRVQPGDTVEEEAVKAAPRVGEGTPLGFVRIVTFDLVEVVTP